MASDQGFGKMPLDKMVMCPSVTAELAGHSPTIERHFMAITRLNDNKANGKKPITEYKLGQDFIRVGDMAKVLSSRAGKRDGFEAKVLAILADTEGTPLEVTVYGGPGGRANIRTLTPERIQVSLAQKGKIK